MFNKKKEKAYLDALANQEYTIMVVEHVLQQMKDVYVTKEHYDELYGTAKKLHTDVHEAAKHLPNYKLYKKEFLKQDLEPKKDEQK